MQDKVTKRNLGAANKVLHAAGALLIASGLTLGMAGTALAKTYTFDADASATAASAPADSQTANTEPTPNADGFVRPTISQDGVAEVDGVSFPLPDSYSEMAIEDVSYFVCADTRLVFTCLLATGSYTEDDVAPLLDANSSLITDNYIIDTTPMTTEDGHPVYLTAYEPTDDPGIAEILIGCLTPNGNILVISASAEDSEASDLFLNTILANLHFSNPATQESPDTDAEQAEERPLTYFSVDRLLCLWGDEKLAALNALSSDSSMMLSDEWSYTPANNQFSANVSFTRDVYVLVALSGLSGYHPNMATDTPVAGYNFIHVDSSRVAVTPGLDQRAALDEIVATAGLTDKFTEATGKASSGDGQRLTYYGKCNLLGIDGVWSVTISPSYDSDTKQAIPDHYEVIASASTLPARKGAPTTYEELQALLDDPASQGVLGLNMG